uniref:Ribonuclease H-like domain-containing protein n=1 Tax=Tanacetum cinerariifolium TaxID=118510 RepID=A0A6L2MY85_TANCI|nr:ribonuclease H-like domain-containing protein [Tanacetum cinerariifolium]
MANQEQNPPQQEQPFVAAKQVGFTLKEIILNPNNEVALLYPKHIIKDHFKCVSNFISKCCLRKPFTKYLNMYKEYLTEFWYSAKALENSKVYFSTPIGGIYGEVGVNTFRNAIGAHHLPHSSEYVAPPSIDIVRSWFEIIRYMEVVPAKGTLKKILLPPSIFWEDIINKLNKKHREKLVPYTRFLSLLMMHKMKEGYGDEELIIYPTQVFTPKPFSNAERVPQGIKPRAKLRHKKHSTSSKQSSVSNKEATKGNDASVVSTAEVDPRNSTPSDFIPQQQLEDLAKLVSYVQPSFKDLDSPKDDPVIVVDDTDEDEDDEIHVATNNETKDTSVSKSLSQSSQIQELTSSLPTELKDLPSKFNKLTEEAKAKFLSLPVQVASVQAKLKTLDALPGEHIKKDKGKKALSLKDADKESTDSDFDDETHSSGSMKLKEDTKAEVAKQEGEVRKPKLVDLLGLEVVKKEFVDIVKKTLEFGAGGVKLGEEDSATNSMVGYADDWAGCPSTRSAEDKYRGVANVVVETAWLYNLLRELQSPLSTATLVYYDNVSTVYMSANLVQHQRTKHIEIDIHFIRDMVTAGQVRVLHVPSRY